MATDPDGDALTVEWQVTSAQDAAEYARLTNRFYRRQAGGTNTIQITARDVRGGFRTAITNIYVNKSWSVVGVTNFFPDGVDSLAFAISPSGVPFMGFTDRGNFRLTVVSYTNGAWSVLGQRAISAGGAYPGRESMAFCQNYPTIAFVDGGIHDGTRMLRYLGFGGVAGWNEYGGHTISPGRASEACLNLTDKGRYHAYTDGRQTNAVCMKYEGSMTG